MDQIYIITTPPLYIFIYTYIYNTPFFKTTIKKKRSTQCIILLLFLFFFTNKNGGGREAQGQPRNSDFQLCIQYTNTDYRSTSNIQTVEIENANTNFDMKIKRG